MQKNRVRLVLLTGAAGNIGSGFRDEYIEKYSSFYRLRLADMHPIRDDRFDEIVQFELEDFQHVKNACEGVDTVIHLAANPSWNADFCTGLMGPNILGAYNLFEAAHQAGCRRVIFASSVHAIMGYPEEYQAHYSDPPFPDTMYGVSKVFGEAMCASFSHLYGMSCIAIRIGGYIPAAQVLSLAQTDNPRLLDKAVTQRDLCQLIHKCVMAPEQIKYLIANGLSKNRFRRMDIEYLKDLLGYEPQDDSFEISQLVELGEEVKV